MTALTGIASVVPKANQSILTFFLRVRSSTAQIARAPTAANAHVAPRIIYQGMATRLTIYVAQATAIPMPRTTSFLRVATLARRAIGLVAVRDLSTAALSWEVTREPPLLNNRISTSMYAHNQTPQLTSVNRPGRPSRAAGQQAMMG